MTTSPTSLWIPLVLGALLVAAAPEHTPAGRMIGIAGVDAEVTAPSRFLTADRCIACHKGVSTPQGEDVSIGYDWRASMMANSARDPYWQAAVRRELIDDPESEAAIEDKCSRCHMPIASEIERSTGGMGSVFANLPGGAGDGEIARLAADGVSCSVCHQIQAEGLGEEASFTGGFTIAANSPPEGRPVFGPFEPDESGRGIMHSATAFLPTEAEHIQSADLCASCHTLFTHAIGEQGREGSEFPEQVPYLEWQASSYSEAGETCQSCHMPEVVEDVPVTGVLGRARPDVSRHVFRGGNFFMLRLLNRYRAELGVVALPQEMQLAADRTVDHLQTSTARVAIRGASRDGTRVGFDISVENRSGHKFPTAYPSRRAWLHVTVTDATGRVVYESGAFQDDGSIAGNDHDVDGSGYEPHYTEITRTDQVQVYEAVMVDVAGSVTTGLMSAERWVKDNRLLPAGFDQSSSDGRIAVYGDARDDPSFDAGSDVTRYRVDAASGTGELTIRAELWFQPIGYRWAENLSDYDSLETDRFVRYYRSMSDRSALVVANAEAIVR